MYRKYIYILSIAALMLGGCSASKQMSHTPDDVYYSPGQAKKDVYAQAQRNEDYENYVSSSEDNYLRMKVHDRYRWSTLDDWYYNPYSYSYGFYTPYYSPYSFYNTWYYNPFWTPGLSLGFGWYYPWGNYYGGYNYYYPPVYYYPSKGTIYTTPRTYRPSLSGYQNGLYNNKNTNKGKYVPPTNNYNNRNRYNSNNNYYNNNNNAAPSRNYAPSGGNSGSSGGGGVQRPSRPH